MVARETRGSLRVVDVPWMVSPSVSGMRIEAWENDDTVVRVNVFLLEGVEPRGPALEQDPRVELRFEMGQWVTLTPVPAEGDPVDSSAYEVDALPLATCPPERYLEQLDRLWRQTQACPNPGFYEVADSGWAATVASGAVRHFILTGHDLKVELLARGASWRYLPRRQS